MGVRSNSMMEPEMVSEDSGFFVASDSEELQDPVMSQQQKPVAPVDASLLLSNGVGVGCPEPIRKTI